MDKVRKVALAVSVGMYMALFAVAPAIAQTAATPETLATDAGTEFRDVGIAVVAALIPLAVALILAKKALPWARQMLHI